ncbi:DUF397 domain-containing protein [Streptomyces litchfieldiae]|uniref:DUF397 domain-containing protein n=1 Tax=Streptomyces litchfieldiae TaxID=3075543 RepID=A0ABU2N082_9ACTN|nr:DUF397 domain-containing protein [Streptomyces sp. DSM 44938]MDT0347284.1 DUF397 domain-containing protein [Streptomyces sp. DSM 44938]
MITRDGIGQWRKSSYSGGNGNCVEVAPLASDGRAVRDSKDPSGPMLTFTASQWETFIQLTQDGQADT